MPRNKRHGNLATIEHYTLEETNPKETETTDMTGTEYDDSLTDESDEMDASPQFSFEVEPAPEGYQPERKNPGRTRTPSPFDDFIVEAYGQGWQRTPYTSEEHKAAILRELNKAKQYITKLWQDEGKPGVGLDQNVTDTHVEWNARELQERKPRKRNGQNALSENQDGDFDDDGDNDE